MQTRKKYELLRLSRFDNQGQKSTPGINHAITRRNNQRRHATVEASHTGYGMGGVVLSLCMAVVV